VYCSAVSRFLFAYFTSAYTLHASILARNLANAACSLSYCHSVACVASLCCTVVVNCQAFGLSRRIDCLKDGEADPIFHRWDDWVPGERLRKLTEENRELANNLKKDMDAQRRAATSKPSSTSTKKRALGSDPAGSSARGSEDRSSAVPQPPRGTKRAREAEGIDKVSFFTCDGVFVTLFASPTLFPSCPAVTHHFSSP
jgi:hypothetical protein